jgi:cytochrome P450
VTNRTGARIAPEIPSIGRDRAARAVARDADGLAFLLETARELGPLVQLHPGVVMATGPTEVSDILKNTDRVFCIDRDLLLRKSGHEPGSAELARWADARRAIHTAMTSGMIAAHAAWLAGQAEALADQMLRRRAVPDLTRMLTTVTAASIARFCFGSRSADRVPAAAQGLLDALLPVYASAFEFPAYMRLLQPREWRVRARSRALARELRSALADRGDGGVVAVLRDRGMDDGAVVRLLTSLHLAGHTAPAAALSWALIELARNPREQERAAAAAAGWDGTGTAPDALGHVIDETLRLWPPNWIADRWTSERAPCGPWTIPARSRILVPFWVVHRTAACYQEPERFDSRRWESLSPPAGSYAPFGAGPRWCPGARFTRAEMATVLAVLLRRARLRLRGTVSADAHRTLEPTGFELLLIPRTSEYLRFPPWREESLLCICTACDDDASIALVW